ncbi:MAG: RluA family pseudouridine synthase [Bacilli bacterium]
MKDKIIYNSETSERLDKWLSINTDFSRSMIVKMINSNLVIVNSKVVNPSYKLQDGDIITYEEFIEESCMKAQEIDFEVMYEDDYLVIINKPVGLVVHPGVGNKDKTLVNGLLYYFNNLSDVDETRPGIVHRIDKDTTGLLIVAKTNKVHELLQLMIKNREVSRNYLALVHGNIKHHTGTIDAPIGRDKNNRQLMCVCNNNSKNAITHFEVIENHFNFTLLKCKLETGRTHQIRVHMKYINHPIVGDCVYGYKKTIGKTQLLHAYKLEFMHPIFKKNMKFECRLPNHFKNVLDDLNFKYKED